MHKSPISLIIISCMHFFLVGASCPATNEELQENENTSEIENEENKHSGSDDFNTHERVEKNQDRSGLTNYASADNGATIIYNQTSSTYHDIYLKQFLIGILGRFLSNYAILNLPGNAISNDNDPGRCFSVRARRKKGETDEPSYLTIMLKKDILIENIAIKHRRTMPFTRESMPKDINIYRIEESDPSIVNKNTKKTKIGHCTYDAGLSEEVQSCELTENAKNQSSRIIQFELTSTYGENWVCLYQVIVEG